MTDNPYPSPETLFVTPELVKKRGFPFFKLLIVLGIIAVLVSLLLPNVRSVPTAALRTQCKNNLNQISLALYNCESMHHALFNAFKRLTTIRLQRESCGRCVEHRRTCSSFFICLLIHRDHHCGGNAELDVERQVWFD